MVLELHPGYGKVSWGLKESISNLRICFQALLKKKYDSVFARHYVEKLCFAHVFKRIFAYGGFKETTPQLHFQKSKTYSEVTNRFFETPNHFSIPRIQFQDHQNNFEKSFKFIALICTVFYLQKGFKRAQIGSFLDTFFAIFSILGHDIKNRSQGRNNLPKYYKKHYKCQGFTPVTFEKIAKNIKKSRKCAQIALIRGGLLKALYRCTQDLQRSSI